MYGDLEYLQFACVAFVGATEVAKPAAHASQQFQQSDKCQSVQHGLMAIEVAAASGPASRLASLLQKQINKGKPTKAHQRTATLSHSPATAIAISTVQVNTVPQNRPNE